MASKYWVKLYHETITDWKFMKMPDGSRLLFYDCLCMAGELDKLGELPQLDEMAFILRKPPEQIAELMEPLIEGKIIHRSKAGTYRISNFRKRQEGMTGTERSQRHRDSENKKEYEEAMYHNEHSNGHATNTVTNRYAEEEREEEEETKEEEELEREVELGGGGNLIQPVDKTVDNFINTWNELSDKKLPETKEVIETFEKMKIAGVIKEDLIEGWNWYKTQRGYNPSSPDKILRPAQYAMKDRLKVDVGEFADFLQH